MDNLEKALGTEYIKTYAEKKYDEMIAEEKKRTDLAKKDYEERHSNSELEKKPVKLNVIREAMLRIVNVNENLKHFVLALPGTIKGDIQVTQKGRELTVKTPKSQYGFYSTLHRRFFLDPLQHVESVSYSDGLLCITVLEIEEEEPEEFVHVII